MGQRQSPGGHRRGEVVPQPLAVGVTAIGDDARRLERDDLPGVQAPPPQPVRPRVMQGQRAPLVEEALVERRGGLRGGGQEQERLALEAVLGQLGVDQGVPAAGGRETGDPGGPGAEGLVRDRTALVAARQRHPVRAVDEMGDVGRLFEQGGPDGLEGRLGADHGEEPEALGVGIAGEGVGRGREARGVDGVEVVGSEDILVPGQGMRRWHGMPPS